jgi:O-acetyl-ADP-ribose deacetylase (regulator of RNase III)
MITWTQGNILDAPAEALVNTVNCVGVMGRGIALQFKTAYPENFRAYAVACEKGDVQPGRMFVFDTGQLAPPRFVINFPTKRHWRGKSRIEDIALGLGALTNEIRVRGIQSVAVPPLGSGLGGLDWAEVRPLVEAAFLQLPNVKVTVFEPHETDSPLVRNGSTRVPTMTVGRASLVSLMNRYMAGLMDPYISLLEIHKLMYFLQCTGEPLRLRYVKAPYGPYAENLRHVLHEIDGHLISGFDGGGDDPTKQIALVPGAVDDAAGFLIENNRTSERLRRVQELVGGFESPFGLELLSTVHWVMSQEGARTIEDAQQATYAWNSRKRQFAPDQVRIAVERLTSQRWINQAL